jgi:hypothetical protein
MKLVRFAGKTRSVPDDGISRNPDSDQETLLLVKRRTDDPD